MCDFLRWNLSLINGIYKHCRWKNHTYLRNFCVLYVLFYDIVISYDPPPRKFPRFAPCTNQRLNLTSEPVFSLLKIHIILSYEFFRAMQWEHCSTKCLMNIRIIPFFLLVLIDRKILRNSKLAALVSIASFIENLFK